MGELRHADEYRPFLMHLHRKYGNSRVNEGQIASEIGEWNKTHRNEQLDGRQAKLWESNGGKGNGTLDRNALIKVTQSASDHPPIDTPIPPAQPKPAQAKTVGLSQKSPLSSPKGAKSAKGPVTKTKGPAPQTARPDQSVGFTSYLDHNYQRLTGAKGELSREQLNQAINEYNKAHPEAPVSHNQYFYWKAARQTGYIDFDAVQDINDRAHPDAEGRQMFTAAARASMAAEQQKQRVIDSLPESNGFGSFFMHTAKGAFVHLYDASGLPGSRKRAEDSTNQAAEDADKTFNSAQTFKKAQTDNQRRAARQLYDTNAKQLGKSLEQADSAAGLYGKVREFEHTADRAALVIAGNEIAGPVGGAVLGAAFDADRNLAKGRPLDPADMVINGLIDVSTAGLGNVAGQYAEGLVAPALKSATNPLLKAGLKYAPRAVEDATTSFTGTTAHELINGTSPLEAVEKGLFSIPEGMASGALVRGVKGKFSSSGKGSTEQAPEETTGTSGHPESEGGPQEEPFHPTHTIENGGVPASITHTANEVPSGETAGHGETPGEGNHNGQQPTNTTTNTSAPATPAKAEIPLTPERISHMTPTELAQIPPERLASLPPETLAKLPPECIAHLPTSALSQIPASTLAAMPPEVLAKIPPETLAQLPIKTLTQLPVEVSERALPHMREQAAKGQYPEQVRENTESALSKQQGRVERLQNKLEGLRQQKAELESQAEEARKTYKSLTEEMKRLKNQGQELSPEKQAARERAFEVLCRLGEQKSPTVTDADGQRVPKYFKIDSQIKDAGNKLKDYLGWYKGVQTLRNTPPEGYRLDPTKPWWDKMQGEAEGQKALEEHANKHKGEFGLHSTEEYHNAAREFATHPPEGSVVMDTPFSDTLAIYDPATHTLGVYGKNPRGELFPITLHKLRPYNPQTNPQGWKSDSSPFEQFLESR